MVGSFPIGLLLLEKLKDEADKIGKSESEIIREAFRKRLGPKVSRGIHALRK